MMLFTLNICFAFLAGLVMGSFSWPVLVAGFAMGYLILWLLRSFMLRSNYVKTLPKVIGFIFYVLWALLLSSIRVAKVVLSPCPRMSPGVIAVPVDLKTEWAIFVLANTITLTPGTLSLSVSEDKKILYVHGMFIDDPVAFRKDIKSSFERKILEFLK